MQAADFISVFAGFLFAALSAGNFFASAGFHEEIIVNWKELVAYF